MEHPMRRLCRARSVPACLSGAVLAAMAGAARGQLDEAFPPVFGLSSLLPENGGDGSLGLVLNGIDAGDNSGFSVAPAGDVNGDGVADLVIGAHRADPGGRTIAGETYVVFGRATGFPASIALSSLDGATGFRIDGIKAGDNSGYSVASAGDVNGDGVDDLVIGAFTADPGGRDAAGEGYVVFGRATPFPPSLELSSLDGATGFRIGGIDAGDVSGFSVAQAGDVNGDGVDDLVIGAFGADPGGRFKAGESYVVFGRATPFPPSIELSSLDGATGFRLDGIDAADYSGRCVAAAGDINGDGVGDLIIGAPHGSPGGRLYAGESYVVFGRNTPFPASIPLSSLDGTTGFRLDGIDGVFEDGDLSGRSVAAAGDVNGDGVDDVVIGASGADPGERNGAGESYVVFGRTSPFPPSIELSSLDGATGFRLDGVDAGERSGGSVAPAGDVNGDGLSDLIIGAHYADPDGRNAAGASYVVFGRTTPFPPSIELSSLDGATGFRLVGIDEGDESGGSVAAAGDINGDGVADLVIGADTADEFTGETYIVFGRHCAADFNHDGQVNIFDFLAFVNAFNDADPAADCDNNGDFDLFDFLCFTNAFNAGCP